MANWEAKSIRIGVDGPADLICGAEVRLKQMLLVLLTNADPTVFNAYYDI
jgi:hypothetical protein